jgi:hypothetical protein
MTAVLLALAALLSAPAPRQWQHTFDAGIRAVSMDPLETCVAVMTSRELAVLDAEGRVVWSRDIEPIVRWMPWGGAVAVSPRCDWAAIAGTPGYHYVWILERHGARRFVAFGREVPVGVAISPDGAQLAVSTGASRLHLFDRHGRRQHLIPRAGFAFALAYTPDGDILPSAAYGSSRVTPEGKLLWQDRRLYCRTRAQPPDWWSISVCSPPHGPQGHIVTVRKRDGTVVSEKVFEPDQSIEGEVPEHGRYVVESDGRTLRVRIR